MSSPLRRIDVLDILRGVAILGTLGTNIWLFTDPLGPAGVLAGPRPPDTLAGIVETGLRWLSNGKFLGLLTILFGIGLELQYRSARRRGQPWPGWYPWRAALLFLEGVLHYLLVFEFDVLMGYAVIAVIVACLLGRSDRVVRVWMISAGVLHLLLVAAVSVAPGAGGPGVIGDPALFRSGSWTDQVTARLEWVGVYRAESVFIIPLGIVLFLLGSRLLRAGVFDDGPAGAPLRRRLMIVGLGVGAPLNLATSFAGPQWFMLDRYVLAPLVALGLLGLVPTVARRMSPLAGPVRRALAAVGRTALSCYVLQNLLATVLCYGWGLGLAARFDELRPWWVPVAWAAISAVFMSLALWWLRRCGRGPLELAWHWAWQAPQRRRAPDPNRPADQAPLADRHSCVERAQDPARLTGDPGDPSPPPTATCGVGTRRVPVLLTTKEGEHHEEAVHRSDSRPVRRRAG